jgi:hypothetical protein
MMTVIRIGLTLGSLLVAGLVSAQDAVVLYNERVVTIDQTLPDATDLWVKPADLTRINDFVLKPEGACLDELCIPVLQDRDSDIYVTRRDQAWFNVSELADKLQQAHVTDYDDGIWSFGTLPLTRQSFFRGGVAPDFELNDRQGNPVKLSDFRGKKVLLLTWASW